MDLNAFDNRPSPEDFEEQLMDDKLQPLEPEFETPLLPLPDLDKLEKKDIADDFNVSDKSNTQSDGLFLSFLKACFVYRWFFLATLIVIATLIFVHDVSGRVFNLWELRVQSEELDVKLSLMEKEVALQDSLSKVLSLKKKNSMIEAETLRVLTLKGAYTLQEVDKMLDGNMFIDFLIVNKDKSK